MRILQQLRFAFMDFIDYSRWLAIVCIGLAAAMSSLSLMGYYIDYEVERTAIFHEYYDNSLVKVQYSTNHEFVSEKEILDYVYEYIDTHKKNIVASVDGVQLFANMEGYTIIGLGNFESFYGIKSKPTQYNLTYSSYESGEYEKELYPFIEVYDEALFIMSGMGRIQVIHIPALYITGDIKDMIAGGLQNVTLDQLFSNFIFVNADDEVVDTFITTLNAFDENIYFTTSNQNDLLMRNYQIDLSRILMNTIIPLGGFLISILCLGYFLVYISDRTMKSYTINLISGAQLKEIALRIFLLNTIVILISAVLSFVYLFFMNQTQLSMFLILQTLLCIVVVPIYPIVKLKHLKLQDNLRGDFND